MALMPTSPSSDLIPARKSTKRRLAEVKGAGTYDDVLSALLEAVPPDELQRTMERKRVLAERAAAVRARMDERIRRGLERTPEKQLLIANLARERWARWRREGRIEEVAPRMVVWNPKPRTARKGVDLAWQPRRGFPAEEGA